MTQDIQIRCINKTDRMSPHERIRSIGGTNDDGSRWRLPLSEAIQGIENGTWRFWTSGGGRSAWVVVAVHEGHKYLKTQADGVVPDNLLALPECP